jgi:hypothetical protein
VHGLDLLLMSPDTSSCVLGAPLGETLGGHNASALESHNTSELHVCLGPGPLCPGGAFVEGTGRNPVCVYPPNLSGYAVLLTIISIMMAFERFPFNSCIHGLRAPRLAHLQMRCRC